MKNKNEPRNYKIYKIENTANGQCYVGLTSSEWSTRKAVTKHEAFKKNDKGEWRYNTPIYASYRKHGEHFRWSVLEEIYADRKTAGEREDYWIKKLNTIYPNGLNCEFGGDKGVRVHYDKSRNPSEKQSKFMKSIWEKMTPQQRKERIRGITKGSKKAVAKRTPEHKAAIVASRKNAWANMTPQQREAWQQKMAAARWGKSA